MGEHGLTEKLPGSIPVFPLPGAILLPRAHLPLQIFEPRYVAMVRDVMDSHKMIGMIQPRGSRRGPKPPLFSVGCAGKIDHIEETDDGRYLITLAGISRFRVLSEIKVKTPYRQVEADYEPFKQDREPAHVLPPALRTRLLARLETHLREHGLRADWDAIRNAEDEMLVNAICMLCPFDQTDKQALLETETLTDRAQALILLMRFAHHAVGESEVRH